jgi:hypothetical protein
MQDFKYRPLAALISGGTVVVVDSMVAGLDLYVNGPASFLGSLPLYLLVLWVVIVFLFKPSVRVTRDSIRITNPFRWIQISISDVVDIETKRGLVLKTKEGSFSVAVGVAPGRYTVARANKSDFKWAGSYPGRDEFVVSPSDILDSDSGAVAYVIRQQIKKFQEGKGASVVSFRPIIKTDFWSILAGAAIGIGTLIQIVS